MFEEISDIYEDLLIGGLSRTKAFRFIGGGLVAGVSLAYEVRRHPEFNQEEIKARKDFLVGSRVLQYGLELTTEEHEAFQAADLKLHGHVVSLDERRIQ